jgi:hypothetical protein
MQLEDAVVNVAFAFAFAFAAAFASVFLGHLRTTPSLLAQPFPMPTHSYDLGLLNLQEIPDGFYLAANSDLPQLAWQAAVIDEVRKVTHIAPADASGALIGETIAQEGLILLPTKVRPQQVLTQQVNVGTLT